MNESIQFEGKNLDSAIQKACDYFDKDKDDLEIEIVDEGSSGIFGLGGRNAAIKAWLKEGSSELQESVENIIKNLIAHIVQDPEMKVSFEENKINVTIEHETNPGLIIGKEGQNIEAIEYLTNRILAKTWPEKYYVQLDAGGYRDKQDEDLKQKVLSWAKKVKETGKVQRTRPLSAYHRRLVHMELQQDKDIITKSVGDGPMKRVLIISKSKSKKQDSANSASKSSRAGK